MHKRKKQRVACEYFNWLLGKRGATYTADGRANNPPQGRHSLGVTNYADALNALKNLDQVMAQKQGLVTTCDYETQSQKLSLSQGRQRYEQHTARPTVTGGGSAKTQARYKAVFDKFIPFARAAGIEHWNEVCRLTLDNYAAWLQQQGYAYATQYLELNTVKQAIKWLVQNGLLPTGCLIVGLVLRKPEDSGTYCWTGEEVTAMLHYCAENPQLRWLAAILKTLACTGMRISELAGLRWSDVNHERNVICLADESTRAMSKKRRSTRTTKNRRGRTFPIHADLTDVFARCDQAHQGFVFRGPRGGTVKPDTVRRIFIRDVLQPLAHRFPSPPDEIGFVDGRLHSFRHYFCSRCANEGVPERVLMQWLGHQSSRMVRRYYHLHDREAQAQMQRLTFLNAGANGSAG